MNSKIGVFNPDELGACISCGYCLPACPTYRISGDESSSPRGRIALMRAIDSGVVGIDDPVAMEQSELCLGCRACEPVCPAGVKYGNLIEQWRDAAWKRKPVILTGLMLAVRRAWQIRLGAALSNHAHRSSGEGQDFLMLGCFERIIFPGVSRAAKATHPNLTVDPDQGCCGALHAHNGALATGEAMARQLGRNLPGTIVTTAGGCAAHLASVIGRERVVEYSEYAELNPPPMPLNPIERRGRIARIAIQDSCHLRNGLGVAQGIRPLIRQVGTLVDLETAHECCGAAGSYALLRPSDARLVLDPKLVEIAHRDLDILVVVNPGCHRHLAQQLKQELPNVEVMHLAEVIAEASDA